MELTERLGRVEDQLEQVAAIVTQLTAAQLRTDQRFEELAAAQARADERMADLAGGRMQAQIAVLVQAERLAVLQSPQPPLGADAPGARLCKRQQPDNRLLGEIRRSGAQIEPEIRRVARLQCLFADAPHGRREPSKYIDRQSVLVHDDIRHGEPNISRRGLRGWNLQ